MLSPCQMMPVSENKNDTQALTDICLAVARHSYFVLDQSKPEGLKFSDRVKLKVRENPTLLNYAKAVYDLCWDENVDALALRSFLELNVVFLDENFDVKRKEYSRVIQQFTQEAIKYRSSSDRQSQEAVIQIFLEHMKATSGKAA